MRVRRCHYGTNGAKRRAFMTHTAPRLHERARSRLRAELGKGRCHECAASLTLSAMRVHAAIRNRLVDDQVAVSNFDVEQALWIGANPGLVGDRGPL